MAEEEKELWASVWLVSDVACQQSFQQVRESRGALHARERERRSAAQRRHYGARRGHVGPEVDAAHVFNPLMKKAATMG